MHSGDQRPIVHIGVELISPDTDLVLGAGDPCKQAEEPLVFDEAFILEFVGDAAHGIVRRNLNGGGVVVLVEGAKIRGQQPANACQNGGDDQHEQNIQHRIDAAPPAAPLLRPLGSLLTVAHLPGIPAGGISPFEVFHVNLHPPRPGARAPENGLICPD